MIPARQLLLRLVAVCCAAGSTLLAAEKPRVIVTSDAEIDDQCSLVRFLLYTNEWDVEGIITSSSQYRWQGHKWPGDDWAQPYLEAYAQVYPQLVQHDPAYPSPAYLRSRTVMGNAKAEGDLAEPSPGSDLIVKALLDRDDPRPVWLQAWGGVNTIARALKTIEEQQPERMAEVAAKCRLFLIWEQDDTYQTYIRPVWGKYEILTIISDQFEAIAYRWKQAQPPEMHRFFEGPWMRANILRGRGPLTALYPAHENGDFRSEGDSPAFLHTIPTGLRNLESPSWGGWGGRYVRVRENTWLDPVPVPEYDYPSGRWFGSNGWGRNSLRPDSTSTPEQRQAYFKPMWRWTQALQNDFAARAAWCVQSYEEANHPPVVLLAHPTDLTASPGAVVRLSALGTTDPDGDELAYHWWHYEEAGSYPGTVELTGSNDRDASFIVPAQAPHGSTIHLVCEVTDGGTPALTRYQRVVVRVDQPPARSGVSLNSEGAAEIPFMSAHFSLDESRGAVVTDLVHGIRGELLNSDPDLAWISGPGQAAVRFDGRASRIVVPHHEAFDFDEESFSLLFWMRWPDGLRPAHQRLLTKGDYDPVYPGETGKRYAISVGAHRLNFTVDDNVVESQINVPLAPFITGEWVHVAAVRDRDEGRLKLYANGELLLTSDPGNPAADGTDRTGGISNPRDLYLGDSSRADAPYHGALDDVRFFRRALTNQQIAAIAARVPLVEKEVPPATGSVAAAAPSHLPPLSAHFPLTEGEGTAINDLVGGVMGGLENANPDTAWTSSDRGLALRLDGVDDRVVVPHSPGFDFRDESFSVAFHLRWNKGAAPRHEHILCKGDYDASRPGETGRRWEINLSPGGLSFIVDDDVNKGQIMVPHTTLLHGHWCHIVAVRDREDKRLKLYIDGRLQHPADPENELYNGVDRTGDISNPRELVIGDSSRRDNALPAELADIRIYRSALNEPQAAAAARLRRHAAANPAEMSVSRP
jgi:hypothetical protein